MDRKHCGKRRKCWLPALSLFPTMFSKGFFFKVVNPSLNKPWFSRVCSKSLLKTQWEKGEIAHNEQFLLFPVFSTLLENFLTFSSKLKMSSAKLFELESLKFVIWKRVKSQDCVVKSLQLQIL